MPQLPQYYASHNSKDSLKSEGRRQPSPPGFKNDAPVNMAVEYTFSSGPTASRVHLNDTVMGVVRGSNPSLPGGVLANTEGVTRKGAAWLPPAPEENPNTTCTDIGTRKGLVLGSALLCEDPWEARACCWTFTMMVCTAAIPLTLAQNDKTRLLLPVQPLLTEVGSTNSNCTTG